MVQSNHKKYARRLGNAKVASLRKDFLNFRQLEEKSLGTSWDHFNNLIITGLDLAIQDPVLLQYFYMGLSKDSMESLDAASRGAFFHLSTSEARAMLNRISGITPYTSIHNELLEEDKESPPEQEEEDKDLLGSILIPI